MPRRARIEFVSLKSSLVNLPISIYGPLVEHHVRPQNLVVHLLLISSNSKILDGGNKKEYHVGWTGMASSSSLAKFKGGSLPSDSLETMEIDPQFASGLGLHLGDIVEIGLLHDLPIATSVVTEPHSTDDWEIIELHAEYVEQNLLSQVRAASIGQEVDVWIFGRTRSRLRIVSFDPPPGKHNAVLLGTNTEVSIAPKKRVEKTTSKGTPVSSKQSKKDTENLASRRLRYLKLRALPASLLKIPEEKNTVGPVALVSISTYCRLSGKRVPLDSTDGFGPVRVERLKPPPNPLSEESSSTLKITDSESAKVIHSNEESRSAQLNGSASPIPEEVTLRWVRHVPDFQVVFQDYDGVKNWESCLLTVTKDSKSISLTEDSLSEGITLRELDGHDLAGIKDFLEKCTRFFICMHLVHQSINRPDPTVSSILLTGRSGSGKTSVANALAKTAEITAGYYTIYIDFAKHAEDRVPKLKTLFRYIYEKASWYRPSLAVFDNLDKLLSPELEHAESFRSRQLTELFINTFMDKNADTRGIMMLATTQSDSSLHPRLIQCQLFKSIFKLTPPDKDARRDILNHAVDRLIKKAPHVANSESEPLNYVYLSTQTEGYLPTDLIDLVSRAMHEAAIRSAKNNSSGSESKILILPADFEKAKSDFVPISLRDVKLQKSDVSWDDIGGLHEPRKVLRETLEWPTKYAAIFAKCPLRLRSGILLYGYPGCGKTLLASAVAKECGLNFISVKGPELLNKYIGASEKSVRDLFDRASSARPCVLFFDEFDSIAPKRGHDSTGVTDRVVNQLLTEMDGAEGLDGVYVLAATSRPDLIDSALLRPGRLDKSLLCDMPNFEERKEILQVVSKKVNVSPDIDWDALASASEGYSGADLQAVIYNAHLDVVHRTLEEKRVGGDKKGKRKGKAKEGSEEEVQGSEKKIQYVIFGGDKDTAPRSKAEEDALQKRLQTILANVEARNGLRPNSAESEVEDEQHIHEITEGHLRHSLTSTRPSVPPEERIRLQRIYHAFVSGRSGEMPVPTENDSVGSRVTLM